MKKLLLTGTLAGSLFALELTAQTIPAPAIEWQRSFGGTNAEELFCFRQTSDGGFILSGLALDGGGGSKTDMGFGESDYWVVRLDRSGNKLWDRCFGGDKTDVAFDVQQTTDGGFILAGFSYSADTGNRSSPRFSAGSDGWVVRLDADGNKVWDRNYTNTTGWRLTSVQQTRDRGFVLAGEMVTQSAWSEWRVIWIDEDGDVIKEQTLGGSRNEFSPVIRQMPDGGYGVAGISSSPASGNKTSSLPGGVSLDLWLVHLNENGDTMWDQSYGGSGTEQYVDVDPTADGGFVMAVASPSPPSGNKTSPAFGMDDLWVVRVDGAGNKLWDQSFGGSGVELTGRIRQTADGGFILAGSSASEASDNKTSPFFGGPNIGGIGGDFWIVRLDANGNKLWEQSYGGSSSDALYGLAQTSDGGFVLAGTSRSPADGNKTTEQFGNGDFWVIKLAPDALSTPPRLRALPQTSEDIRRMGFRFTIEGRSNQNYVIEASSDQVAWSPFQTNRIAGASTEIVDSRKPDSPRRFYRARPVP